MSLSLTILHVSDLQFGPKHRFATTGNSGQARLLDSIRTDLELLRESERLPSPDLVFVTGDLTERAKPSEFDACAEFVRGLAETVRLPITRVVVIPGNHDISRDECEGFFKTSAAREQIPEPPFWPKWNQYDLFLQKLYGTDALDRFNEEEPWTLLDFPDLRVVVAGLNSTMAESHRNEDHYGFLGAEQVDWFAQRLEPYVAQRWLRLAAVHHNIRRGPIRDDENLRDADVLRRKLSPFVNAVFHGHTHDGDLDWLSQHVPILATGSAAVVASARPDEVANQYQVVMFERDAIQRWTRAYVPVEDRWIGDTRGSRGGSEWKVRIPVSLAAVDGTFPSRDSSTDPGISLEITREPSAEEEFLSQVARVCALRERSGAQVDRIRRYFGREYLQVIVADGDITRVYPIGVSLTVPEEEAIDFFLRRVHRRYAANDSGVISHFVYGGERQADKELVRRMQARRVHVMSFVEYQGLLDFRTYLAEQTSRLLNDAIYPPSLYVPQRICYSHVGLPTTSDDALATLQGWLAEPAGRFVLVLGDFGAGKTFLVHELARTLAANTPGITPVLVQLRDLEKGRSLEQLLAQHFAQHGLDDFSIRKFRYMLEEGRIALLFDGFDELVVRVTYAKAADHFDTLLQAASGNAKVVITSRTQHFVSHQQIRTAIGDRVESLSGHRIATLQGFDDRCIREFLLRKFGDEAIAKSRFEMLSEIKDLIGLSKNPRMLSFIADLTDEQLTEARKSEADITPAALYRLLLSRWLTQESDRVQPRGAPPGLSVEDRWRAVTELALRLWRTTDRGITVSELTESTASVLNFLTVTDLDSDAAAFQVGSGTLLVRDDEGNFSFIHQSVQEWLIASRVASELEDSESSELMSERDLTSLTIEFLIGLASRERLVGWAEKTLTFSATDAAKRNAVAIENRTGVHRRAAVEFGGQDARGMDFSRKDLLGANFRDANLTASRFVQSNLEHAEFENANLTAADLSWANLRDARFTHANLSRAKLAGADLTGARFDGANLERTVLLGAKLPADVLLSAASTFGAALRITERIGPEYESEQEIFTSIAVSPDEAFLVTASDRLVSICDLGARQVIRQVDQRGVTALYFDGDGRGVVGSTRAGDILWWDLETGHRRNVLNASSDPLTCMAMNDTGDLLVTGGEDATTRVWRRTTGEATGEWVLQHQFRASAGFINSVAIDSSERLVAAASNDRLVYVWDLVTGELVKSLRGHLSFVRSVVFGWNSVNLITASSGQEVLVWNLETGDYKATAEGAAQLVVDSNHRNVVLLGVDLTIYDSRLESTTSAFQDFKHVVRAAFRSDNLALYVTCGDGAIRLFDLTRGTFTETLSTRQRSEKRARVAFSSHGDTLATVDRENQLRLWDIETGQQWWQEIVPGGAIRLGHVEGRMALATINKGVLHVRDLGTGRQILCVKAALGQRLATGRKGRWICVGNSDSTISIISLSNQPTRVLSTQLDEPIVELAMSRDEELVAVATSHRVVLFDADSGSLISSFQKSYNATTQLAFAHDNALVVAIDGNFQIFQELPRFEKPLVSGSDSVVFALHPDRPALVTGASTGWVSLWDINTGEQTGRHRLHRAAITSMAFTPDGAHVAVAGADGAVLYCVADQGRLEVVGTFLDLTDGWVSFAPDGRYKYGGAINRRFWHVIGLCRFEVGDLVAAVPDLQVPNYLPLFNRGSEDET